jgi:hypothetical protein
MENVSFTAQWEIRPRATRDSGAVEKSRPAPENPSKVERPATLAFRF